MRLNKRFGGLPATKEVSLTVMPGERRLIIGPNGAGKTTLFNLVTGDLTPDTGSVKLFGQELLKLPTQQRVHLGLARTYQILTLFPKETLVHNVVLALLGLDQMRWNPWMFLSGQRALYDAAHEALTLVGLGASAERAVAETSYGERRRLEMAMALAQKPKVLLLDEPLAGLSQEERGQVRALLAKVPRDVTIVMIEHDMDQRARLRGAHHAAALRRGDRRRHPRRGCRRSAHQGGVPWRVRRSASATSIPITATATCCTASAFRSSRATCSDCSAATAPARPPAWRPSWASCGRAAARSRCSARTSRGSRRRRSPAKASASCRKGRRVFRSLTVRENLEVARQDRADVSKPWTIERVFALFPRLAERHAQFAGSLSGGEQQMLAIGRALMGNPRVLLMDEPSEGLAPQIVHEVGRTIAQLKAEGLSIVLVEQNIKLTLDLADEVVIVNTGAVVFSPAPPPRSARDEKRSADSVVAPSPLERASPQFSSLGVAPHLA